MFLKRQKKEINPDQISQSLTDKKPNKRRRIWKFVILGVFVVLVSLASWVGYSGWNAIKNVTSGSGNNSFWNFLTNHKPSTLSGEKDDRVNVLIVGFGGAGHPGGLLADTIMVASYKPGEKKAAFISIPRDLYVSIPGYGYGKINTTHSYGESHKSSGGGPAVLKQVVSEVLGIPIHYYVRGDFSGFKEFVDKIGGIDVNVKKTIYDSAYPKDDMVGYTTFYLKKGMQHLDGDTALKYARSRHSSSDFDRARRQQDILLAIKTKTMSAGILANPKKVVDLLGVLGTHVRTDMSIQNIERFVQVVRDVDEKNTKQIVLDNGPDGVLVSSSGGSAGYILKPRTGDFAEIQSIAQNIFKEGSGTSEGATVEIRNGTGQAGQALAATTLLKTFGYSATAYMQPVTTTAETVLYDYSSGKKPYTAEFLKKYFNARIEESSEISAKDFVLILGSDYLTNKPSAN